MILGRPSRPLVGMFTGLVGRPMMIKGGEERDADAYEWGAQWERHPISEASVEQEEEEDDQEILADDAGQEAPGAGYSQLDQILESISAL